MTWSSLYRLDPGVSYFQDLTWSSLTDWTLASVWFIQRDVHDLVQTGPWCQLFPELTWSSLCRLDPVVSFGFVLGTRGLTWSSLFRLDPGVSLVPNRSLAWFSLSRLDPVASLVLFG